MVIVSKWLVWPAAKAWTLWPFIFIRDEKYRTSILLNHERIHLAQQKEMLVIPFFVLYILNFVFNLITMNKSPYKNIVFEKEAFENEDWDIYLKIRKFWAWVSYL